MTPAARLARIAVIVCLGGCAGAPPARLVTLDQGGPRTARSSTAPRIAVVRADLPELIDRPQLVIRTDGHRVTFSEQYRWAEPLRRQIPRLIAHDLGEILDAAAVAALPGDGFDPHFKLSLDFQQLDAVAGHGIDVDVRWRLEDRSRRSVVGRSRFRQPLAQPMNDQVTVVTAQRQALRRVAAEIAKEIAAFRQP
ncbi:MAG: PqiC family protein [Pseudomonadota bacterium]